MNAGRPCPDPEDVGYTLRRALMIRGQLGMDPDDRLDLDADLLRALLLVPEYRHGARSVEKLIKPLVREPGAPLHRSDLPSPALLDMYVDAAQFDALMDQGRVFAENEAPQQLAPKIHQAYLEAARGNWDVKPHINRPFEQLAPEWKDDNIEAARRIPAVLALIGLGVEPVAQDPPSPGPDEATLKAHLRHNLERLAEAEHDGWWAYRTRNGWTCGEPRSDDKRIHPMMIPYADLDDAARQRDRNAVTNYPNQLATAGYRAVWLQGLPDGTA